jgi:hypothetical protein
MPRVPPVTRAVLPARENRDVNASILVLQITTLFFFLNFNPLAYDKFGGGEKDIRFLTVGENSLRVK